MGKQILKTNWAYLLLVIPAVMAVLALNHWGFFFKSGSAGAGILILGLLYFRKLLCARDVWMIIVAFAFSIAGDWFLSHRHGETIRFVIGIALFFFAHVGYLSYALMNGRLHRFFTVILLVGYLLFYFLEMAPAISDRSLMVASLIYLLISCFSLGAAVGLKADPLEKAAFILGIFLVLFSDTIIALREFIGVKEYGYLILPTYYLAHLSITFSLIRKNILSK